NDKSKVSKISFELEQKKLNPISFGHCDHRSAHHTAPKFTDRDELGAKILAHLISMTVQLKYLIVENFRCLVYVIEHIILR
ncbi:unnamed protein product, partial [Rotaria socialis]